MGVTCQILVNKSQTGLYYPEQTISGIVKFIIDKPTKYNAVTLSFLGDGECKWSEPDGSDGTNYYKGTEHYINVKKILFSQPVTLQNRLYECPFQFQLPEGIPSSFKNKFCTIRYHVRLKFVKSSVFSIDKKFNVEIPVYGYVEPAVEGPLLFGLDKSLFKLFSAKNHLLKLRGVLENPCLTPGENAQMTLRIINDTDEKPRVKVDLYCYTILVSNDKKTNRTCEKIKDCFNITNDIRKRSDVKISLIIPTKAGLYTINCKILKNVYMLRVELILPAPHRNAVVEVPVVIGLRRGTMPLHDRHLTEHSALWR